MSVNKDVMGEYQGIIQKFKAQGDYSRGNYAGGGSNSGLEMISALRQLTSAAKVPFTCDIIRNMLRNDKEAPIVVFAWYRDTARQLADALEQSTADRGSNGTEERGCDIRCGVITGDIIKQSDRQEIVDAFQSSQLDVVICSYGVGATGLTLTRSHNIILLDRPWTPGDARQAEDRVRRIGQKAASIHSMWIAGFSIDDTLDNMLQKKDKNCETVICGDSRQSPVDWFQQSNQSIDSQRSTEHPNARKTSGAPATMESYFKPTQMQSAKSERSASRSKGTTSTTSSSEARALGAEAKEEAFVWSSTDREAVEQEPSGRGKDNSFFGEGAAAGAGASVMKTLLHELVN
mmetsp:Transcript_12881/g.21026  ORF Transcript_12881/g.21026 Transcript_12881/m.21026 type:complete len:347 (-) Transcript_12881:3-1043(-)